MLRQFSPRRLVVFRLVDWLGTPALLLLAAWLHAGPGGPRRLPPAAWLLVAAIWPCLFTALSVYDGRHNGTLRAELLHLLEAAAVSTAVLAGAFYLIGRELPRVVLLAFFAFDATLLPGTRVLLWAYRRSERGRRSRQRRRVLIVGAGPVGCDVARQLGRYAQADLLLAGYVDDDQAKQGHTFDGLQVLGTLDDAPALVAMQEVQDAVVALPLRAHERLVGVCRMFQGLGVRVHVVPDLLALSFPSATLDGFGGIPVVDLGCPGISGWRRTSKRAFDTALALLGLVVASPLFAAIAVLIKLDSPGPVIYKQERIGENGRPFTMYKFRSMYTGADPSIHKAHVTRLIEQNVSLEQRRASEQSSLKMARDPRVTRIGRVIRKASLDELPQLFNVLRGDMSLVGPRPPLAYEVDLYQPWHRRRLEAIPGITGLWQVEGRNQVSFDEMVRLDLKYLEQQSLWVDIKILIRTPLAVLAGRGAG